MLWLTVVLCLLAHAAAILWFRSGQAWLGAVLVLLLWLGLDAAAVMRFVWDRPESEWLAVVVAVDVLAALSVMHAAFLFLRRRGHKHRARRDALYREGLVAFMQDDRAVAARRFATLARRDPWDRAALDALAMVRAAKPYP